MTQVLSAMPTRFHSHSKFPARSSVGRGRGRVLPSSLAFGECANSGMMPTGFISAAAAHRAGKDGKSRRVLAEVAVRPGAVAVVGTGRGIGWRASVRTGRGRPSERGVFLLPVSRSRRPRAKPQTIKPPFMKFHSSLHFRTSSTRSSRPCCRM